MLKYSQMRVSRLIPQSVKNTFHFIQGLGALIYFGYCAGKLKVVGITGTDGKTTTASIIYHVLVKVGKKEALISTVAAFVGKEEIDTGFHVTTPDAWKLQKLIRKIVSEGCEYLVLEATSHGFDQHRLVGINIGLAGITNITNEHLDYHKNYNRYVLAKSKILKKAQTVVLDRKSKY